MQQPARSTGGGRLLDPPLDATRPLAWTTTPRGEFEEDFVDRLSLGNGAVDHFAVNVVIDHDALHGTVFFVGAGDTEQFPPVEEAEDMRGDFQHVPIHPTRTSTLHRNIRPAITNASGRGIGGMPVVDGSVYGGGMQGRPGRICILRYVRVNPFASALLAYYAGDKNACFVVRRDDGYGTVASKSPDIGSIRKVEWSENQVFCLQSRALVHGLP